LCMWMVYSRATTSAMADRVVLPVGFLVVDISSDAVSKGSYWHSRFEVLSYWRMCRVASSRSCVGSPSPLISKSLWDCAPRPLARSKQSPRLGVSVLWPGVVRPIAGCRSRLAPNPVM
jgi:hypothetical protein